MTGLVESEIVGMRVVAIFIEPSDVSPVLGLGESEIVGMRVVVIFIEPPSDVSPVLGLGESEIVGMRVVVMFIEPSNAAPEPGLGDVVGMGDGQFVSPL